jgi:hypothetical protein
MTKKKEEEIKIVARLSCEATTAGKRENPTPHIRVLSAFVLVTRLRVKHFYALYNKRGEKRGLSKL